MDSVLSTDDWDRLGYSDWPNRQPPDLTYPINPIFKKDRFWGCEEEWYLIEPALRLASAFLATPASMLFIYSLVYECKRLPSQFDIEGEPHYQFRLTEERDPKVLLPRMHRIWQETAAYSCFGPSRGKETSRMDEIALAETSEWYCEEAEPDYVGGPDLKGNKRYGFRPSIRYHEGYTKQMWRLLKEGKKNDLQMLIIQFEFAVTMCHEATHAIRYASSSRYKLQRRVLWNDGRKMTWRFDVHEPYFEDQWQAELGHAWEQEVLGGRIRGWVPSDGEEQIVPTVSAWPDRANLNYEYEGSKCSQRGILPLSGPDPDYYEDCYPVSCRYIHEVQQQRFWNKLWRSIGKKHNIGLHIRVPKLIGYRQRWVSASSIPLQTFLDQVGGVELMLQAMQDRLEGRDEVIMTQERIVYRNTTPRMISNVAFSDQASDPEATKQLFSELPFLRQQLDLDDSDKLSSKFSRLLALDLAGSERLCSNISRLLALFPKHIFG